MDRQDAINRIENMYGIENGVGLKMLISTVTEMGYGALSDNALTELAESNEWYEHHLDHLDINEQVEA